ncbi:SDR family oxidoreductase [Luedemannella flava]
MAATGLGGLVGSRVRAGTAGEVDWLPLQVDIREPDATLTRVAATPADVVVNFAAFTDVSAAYAQRGREDGPCFRTNVLGARHLARACARAGKHLVHISTDYVFAGDRAGVYTEDEPGDATEDWYGFTKRLAEDEIRARCDGAAIVRIAAPFSALPGVKEEVVGAVLRQLGERTLPPMFVDRVFTPTCIEDLAALLVAVIRGRVAGTFHAVTTQPLSPYDFAVLIADAYGRDAGRVRRGELADYLSRGGRPYPRRLALANAATGDRLGVSLRDVPTCLAAMRATAMTGTAACRG